MKPPRITKMTHGKNGLPDLPAVGDIVKRSQPSIVHIVVDVMVCGLMTHVNVGCFMSDCDGRDN
jgi:hypothetical protein